MSEPDGIKHAFEGLRRGQRGLKIAFVCLMVGLLGLAAVLARVAQDAEKRAENAAAERSVILSRAQVLEDQLIGVGEKPAVRIPESPEAPPAPVPSPSPGPRGPAGGPGPAPSQGQIDQAVASYCQATGACTGPAGKNASVTAAQVAAAVTAYCDPRGQCQGPRGAAGDDSEVPGPQGNPGQDSTVPGPQGEVGPAGPPPSAEAVAQAVADFCARAGEPCRGPVGPQGPAGPPGADSNVPGPAGPPGPTCPDGFTGSEATVVTSTGPRQAFVCFAA